MSKEFKIVCPHCGAEYTISEVYYRGELEGQSETVVRDENGRILFVEDNTANDVQSYNCDYCGKDFIVESFITFKCYKSQRDYDFKDEEKEESSIKENEIF